VQQLSVQEVCNWFEDKKYRSVLIQKEEQNDRDQIELEVQEVALLEQPDTEDDYIPTMAIVLRGMGTIQNQSGEKIRLPQDYYEIPLEGQYQGSAETGSLHLQTERARYSIQIQ
jgi:hypothetical protein